MSLSLHLTDAETEALRSAAQAEGISAEDFARRAVRQALASWASERDAFLTDFAAENRSLLDRLSR